MSVSYGRLVIEGTMKSKDLGPLTKAQLRYFCLCSHTHTYLSSFECIRPLPLIDVDLSVFFFFGLIVAENLRSCYPPS